jgi:simple sugar transport system permease protein
MSDQPAAPTAEPPSPTSQPFRSSFALRRSSVLLPLAALAGALVFTTLILLAAGTPPLRTFQLLFFGAFSTPARASDMIMLAAPLILCAAGLTLTFSAGLYNLGVEGQMGLGAVFALGIIRLLPDAPPLLLWALAFLMGALGGALWAQVVVLLRRYARVSEIFSGLGLNFLATGLTLYLVVGPWKRPGVAAITGTEQLPEAFWLPTVGRLRLAPIAPVIALAAVAVVWFALTRTRWGLSLRASGLNPVAAARLGVPATRRMAEALAACGALAGLAGAIQVLGVFHQLIPNISSGIGLLGLLVALLVRANPAWVLPIALVFACFTVGSIQLPLALNADSSIAGVLQGALVLFALLARSLVRR